MVEGIECIQPEFRTNPLGYVEMFRQRQVYGASRRPQAVADRRIPDRAQREAIHGVSIRVDPLVVGSKVMVSARLPRNQVRPLDVRALADT